MSLEAQRTAIEAFSARNDITISQWFEEKQTAAKSGRPVFGEMLKLLKRGKADGVVMHKIDRSARNFADWAKIGDLSDAGIDVHFASESLDFRSRGGRLAADIQAVVAADYIRNLREEAIKGIYGRLEQGIYPFNAPIGYLNNGAGKPKTLDPVRAPLIREMFDLYATNTHSIRSLRTEMELRGLRNTRGKPLTLTGVETVLGNPFYCGIIRIKRNGSTYPGAHEALISTTLFELIQDIKRGKYGKKRVKHRFTYRRIFRCAKCGTTLTAERHKGRIYYRCPTQGCRSRTIREEVLEKAVEATLAQVELTDEAFSIAAERVEQWLRSGADMQPEDGIRLQITQLESRMDTLTDALIDRVIDKDIYANRRERLLFEKARLEERLVGLHGKRSNVELAQGFLERMKKLSDSFRIASPSERREIVEIGISTRHITGEKLRLEPSNWLGRAETMISTLSGGADRDGSRRVPSEEDIAELVELIRSPEGTRLLALGSAQDDASKREAA